MWYGSPLALNFNVESRIALNVERVVLRGVLLGRNGEIFGAGGPASDVGAFVRATAAYRFKMSASDIRA